MDPQTSGQETKPTRLRRLTFKQKRFVKEYVANNGNATQAAIKVYNTQDYKTASDIGSSNLENPQIQRSIEDLAADKGVTQSGLIERFNQIGLKESDKWTGDTILKANIELAKILKMYPDKKSIHLGLSVKAKIKDMKLQDIKKELQAIDGEVTEIVNEDNNP